MTEAKPAPQIVEAYKNYSPPPQVTRIVRVLLQYVPPEHLVGLRTIVLTNYAALSHDNRRHKLRSRGRRVDMRRVLGSYHQAWKGNPAWIDLFVDLIDAQYLTPFMYHLPFFPYVFFADVLYHEIGHHIQKTSRPEFNEREDVADKWRDKLEGRFLRRRYWYLSPLFAVAQPVFRLYERAKKARQQAQGSLMRNR